jgi:hypothetical protein
VGKVEVKRLLGRPRRRWANNIELVLVERWNGVLWAGLSGSG